MADLPDDFLDELVDHKEETINDEKSTDVNVPAEEEEVKTETTEVETDQTKVDNAQVGVEESIAEAEAALEGQLEILGISEESQSEDKEDSDSIGSSLILKNEKVDDDANNKVREEEELKELNKDIVPGCVRGRWQEISTEGDSSWDSTSSQVLEHRSDCGVEFHFPGKSSRPAIS